MLVFQARAVLSADLPRLLPRLLFFCSARRPVYPADAATQPHLRLKSSPRAPPLPMLQSFKGAPPATGACASPLLSVRARCALSVGPSATGARASSAAPLSYGIIRSAGACALGAASLSRGTGSRAPSAAPSSHAPRSSQTATPARRSFQRGCPTPPPPGHAVAVSLR